MPNWCPFSQHDRTGRHLVCRVVSALAVGLSLVIWPPGLDRPQAEAPPARASQAVASSTSQLSPVPAYRLFPPQVLGQLADQARSRIWSLPDDKTWPTDNRGRPIVETAQVDRLHHPVQPGETVDRITTKYRISRTRLAELNPGTDLSNLVEDQRLVVWERDDRNSVSYGASDWGRLRHSEPLPPDDDYEILFMHRIFGTYYTVSETRRVLTNYYEKFPDAHKLIIGDISFRKGGAISPHHSHQTGRDIDISYPRRDPPPTLRQFNHVSRGELDVDQTLYLLKTLLDRGYVDSIFMDRSFQKKLYREAERRGAPDSWLEQVFEYPDWGSEAIVQHSPGHRNHLHIRFRCQPTDRRCH